MQPNFKHGDYTIYRQLRTQYSAEQMHDTCVSLQLGQ